MSVRLFVGNLDYAVSESTLRELFAQCGAVTSVRIPRDRDSGQPRGFAFVDLAEAEHADEAMRRLNDTMLEGRRVTVRVATERTAGPSQGGGGPSRPYGGGGGGGGPQGGGYGGGGGGYGQGASGSGGQGPAPARRFGPDSVPAAKRKPAGRDAPRGPKGPMRERRGGGMSAGPTDDAPDEVPFWAVADASNDDDRSTE